MKTVNSTKRIYFVSLACIPKIYDESDIESITGGIIRVRKGNYLHAPLAKIECNSKQQLIDKLAKIAEHIWDNMKKTGV